MEGESSKTYFFGNGDNSVPAWMAMNNGGLFGNLMELGCDKDEAFATVDSLEEEGFNVGSIYSNTYRRRSLIIIGKADSTDEFYDTFDHEKGHLAMHICIADNIDPFSEEYQYLAGEIGKKMFKAAKELFCEECRKKYL